MFDRFAVAAATLSLLVAVAEEGPLLVIVDDLHWLDPESSVAITFAARRLDSEPIAMLLAARPEELDRDLEPDVLSGGAPLERIPPATVEEQYARRIALLSPQARAALLVYALLDSPQNRASALAALGLDLEALDEAESVGLLHADGPAGPAFRHPLVRAAAYNAASLAERRAGHRAIASVLDREVDADERALHLAAAATKPDEALASALATAADSAHRRGGFAASARICRGLPTSAPNRNRRPGA